MLYNLDAPDAFELRQRYRQARLRVLLGEGNDELASSWGTKDYTRATYAYKHFNYILQASFSSYGFTFLGEPHEARAI